MVPTDCIGHDALGMRSKTKHWRTILGTSLFVLGCVLPLFIPLLYLLPLNGWWLGALTALFALGLPELLWLLAALCIGREGFARLKQTTMRMCKMWWIKARRATRSYKR